MMRNAGVFETARRLEIRRRVQQEAKRAPLQQYRTPNSRVVVPEPSEARYRQAHRGKHIDEPLRSTYPVSHLRRCALNLAPGRRVL
ncbi:hypothetical protein RRF57_006729 [Xylaria bambusicola]|uniref:Uncharacterized protein n=1 Tax=Xylaria bambusicola TaxID=326684 RepID=A0AAN7UPE4_9PEZI